MAKKITFPFEPKSNVHLRPGQFFAVPLTDGRFACGRVLRVDRDTDQAGSRTNFVGALLDWVGDEPPTEGSIAGALTFDVFTARIKMIRGAGGQILGHRALALDGIEVPGQVIMFASDTFIVVDANERFVASTVVPPGPLERRALCSPLTDEMLAPMLAPGTVQFSSMLTDPDLQRLDQWFEVHPHVSLRVWMCEAADEFELEFLRHLPHLRRFTYDPTYAEGRSLQGLRHLSLDLRELGVGGSKRRLDLAPLARFTSLETLYLEGQTKNIDVISSLTTLRELTLRSVTLPDLSLLLPLRELRSLTLLLGGTKDLSLLPEIGQLQYFAAFMVRGLTDVSAVGKISTLRKLFLDSLRRVETLPDLSGATSLVRVELQTMKGLTDLSPLLTAPALRDLECVDMGHLKPAHFECLVGTPTLRSFRGGLGSDRKNHAVQAMFNLPDVSWPWNWRTDP